MKKNLFFLLIFFFSFSANSFSNQKIIDNLNNINSLEFKFIQKIDNNNTEKGECIILYPKKIFCEYYDIYNKKTLFEFLKLIKWIKICFERAFFFNEFKLR